MNEIDEEYVYRYRKLEEINHLIRSDPELYRFYLMRVNYYARTSQNPKIQECEIKYMVNHPIEFVVKSAQENLEKLRNLDTDNDVTVQIMLKDLKKVIELKKQRDIFVGSLDKNDFTSVVKSRPKTSAEYNEKGLFIFENFKEKHDEIFEAFQTALLLSPNNYMAWCNSGDCARVFNDDQDSAIDSYSRTISIDENFCEAYSHRGMSYMNLEKHKIAILDFSTAVRIRRLFDERKEFVSNDYCNIGVCYRRKGEREKAFLYYDRACEIYSDNHCALNNRASCYYDAGKFQKSLDDYNRALAIKPKYEFSLYGRGLVHHRTEKFDLAIKDFSDLIDMNVSLFATKYLHRGKCFLMQEKFEKAIIDFTEGNNIGVRGCVGMRNHTVEELKRKIMRYNPRV